MWNEWFGMGPFQSEDFPGGIQVLEETGKAWRKHFSTADQKHFSRLKFIINHIQHQSDESGMDIERMLAEYDLVMTTNKFTLSTFHTYIKKT